MCIVRSSTRQSTPGEDSISSRNQLLHGTAGRPPDEQFLAVHAELDGDGHQQRANGDGRPAVPGLQAGQLTKPDAEGGDDQPQDRGAVLEQGHLARDVGAGLHVVEDFGVLMPSLAAYLPVGTGE
jgi:hypothetical protein